MLKNAGIIRREKVIKLNKKTQIRAYTLAICPICNKKFEALFDNVKRGITKSCGCRQSKNKHLTTPQTYKSWQGIKDRCTNKKISSYKQYGGRGITFDPRWEYFDNFLADMGDCPKGMTIERINNNGNYNKNNCRWATYREQANNRRSNLYVEYRGKKDTLANWCRILQLDYKTAWAKLKKGNTLENLFISHETNL